jgi:type I restriction enzyme, S subunit
MKSYPSYKDSGVEWIGEIPSGWDITRFKFIGKVIIGLSYKPNDIVDEHNGTLVMRSSNIQNGKPSFLDNVYVKTEIPEKLRTKEGDILICSRNGSRKLIGKNCVITKDIEGMSFGVFMTIFRSQDWEFVYWVLNSQIFKSQSGLYLTSTINQLTVSTLKNFIIPFTRDSVEQQQISNYLDHKTRQIDTLIEKTQQKIELLKEQRTSLINRIVTKGLNPNVEMKDSGVEWIGEIPSGWETKKLNHICSKVRNGYVGPTRGIMKDCGVKYIQGIHIKKGDVEFTPNGHYYVSEEWSQKNSETILQEGDVLVVQTGTIGNVGYLQKELENSNCHALIIVRIIKSKGVGRFLHYYFLSSYVQNFLQTIKTGEILYHINTKKLRPLKTLVPPLQEQQQIVDYLDKETTNIDTLIEKENQQIDLLTEYRQSLISEVVTGKVDVRDEVFV